MVERGASESDNPNYKMQLNNLSRVFVISIARMFAFTGMFDSLEVIEHYQFLGEREWGKKGGRAWDIKIKLCYPTTGKKLATLIENFLKVRTPPNIHRSVFCVVKSLDYVKKIKKLQAARGEEEQMEVDKPKKEGCQKCASFVESGHARGSHSKNCKHYRKPVTKKAKHQQAYMDAVAAMSMTE